MFFFSKKIQIILLVHILVFGVIFPFLKNSRDPFVSDDWNFLYVASSEKTLAHLLVTNTQGEIGPGTFRPIVNTFWFFAYRFFGLNPLPYHLTLIILHVLNSVLVGFLTFYFFRLKGQRYAIPAAFFAGLFFGIFPNRSESVIWISVINDVLVTTAYITSILFLLYSFEWKGGKRAFSLVISFISAAVAIFTKEVALTLPGIAALALFLQWFYKEKNIQTLQQRFYSIIPLVFLVGLYMYLRFEVTGFLAQDYSHQNIHFSFRMLFDVFIHTVSSHFFSGEQLTNVFLFLSSHKQAIGIIAGLFLCTAATSALKKKEISLFWFPIIGFPLSLIPVIHQGVDTSLLYQSSEGERFSYFPSIFIAFGLALCVQCVFAATKKRYQVLLASFFTILICFFLTQQLLYKNKRWHKSNMLAGQLVESAAQAYKRFHFDGMVFIGMPDTLHGTFIYRNAFDLALEVFHDIPKEKTLVASNRTLLGNDGEYTFERSSPKNFTYNVKNAYITDTAATRVFSDYTTDLLGPTPNTRGVSNVLLGHSVRIIFSDLFFKTNEKRRIGIFIFNGKNWDITTLIDPKYQEVSFKNDEVMK